jgi:hypothetical protein
MQARGIKSVSVVAFEFGVASSYQAAIPPAMRDQSRLLIEWIGLQCVDAVVIQADDANETGLESPGIPAVALIGATAAQVQAVLVRLRQGVALDVPSVGSAGWLWHPDTMPPWALGLLSPRQPQNDVRYAAMIESVCLDATGGGWSCTERHVLATGEVVEHNFPMATGWRWLCRQAQYRSAFGQEMPCWTKVLHPARRGSLVQLALSLQRPIPAHTPLSGPLPRIKRAE